MLEVGVAVAALHLGLALVQPEGVPDRRELRRALYRADRLTVVYAAEDGARTAELAAAARGLAPGRVTSMTLVSASEARAEDLERGPIALVGTPRANPWIAAISERLPMRLDEREFEIQGRSYSGPSDGFRLFYPSPFEARSPMLVVSGNSDAAVLESLRASERGDLHVLREGRTLLVGFFEGGFGAENLESRGFEAPPDPACVTSLAAYFTRGLETPATLSEIALRQEALGIRIRKLFAPACALPRFELHLYQSLEDKGLATESTAPAHFEEHRLHAAAGRENDASIALAEGWLDACRPELPGAVRRGLARALVLGASELDALDETARRLKGTRAPPSLFEPSDRDSPYARAALETSFARFLVAALGAERIVEHASELRVHEARWARSLGALPGVELRRARRPRGFHHGLTFAHQGYRIVGGYLSERASRSLEELRDLGADAVAIVPYAFMRDPRTVEPLRVPTRAGSETDEAVVASIRSAHAKGMSVLLKPQIWLRGSWPGAIEPANEAEAERFFREYRAWMLHYALIAERNDVALLAIGTELESLTRGHHDRWAALIEDVRRVYGGELVYAANWGKDVEQVSFWPLLDYIGVDFYYPLSASADPTDEELATGFARALAPLRALSRRHRKPVLLTEIGYASTESPWREPHASDRLETLSLGDQERAYEVALRALEGETSWVRGMYWWKWPSDPGIGGERDRSFTPNRKPAADVLRRFYRRRLE